VCAYADTNSEYYRQKNAQLIIPVLGRYNDNNFIAPDATFASISVEGNIEWLIEPVLVGGINSPCNLIDGVISTGLQDLNEGQYTNSIIQYDKSYNAIKQFVGLTSTAGGSPNHGTTLSLMTRYVSWDLETQKGKRIDPPEYLRNTYRARKDFIAKMDSKSKIEYFVYAPVGADLKGEYDRAVSSSVPVTKDISALLDRLILPTYELSSGNVESVDIPQVQTETFEVHSYKTAPALNQDPALRKSRYDKIEDSADMIVTGLANTEGDELTNYLRRLSEAGKGSFIQDIFGVASQIAGSIGL
jgi:hypothetical protein